jgi:LmbE family N-acetylglucosaminyl deacetylase
VPVDVGAQRLVDLFEQYRPDVVITYADNGGYNHPDHVHAHRITVAAVERSTVPQALPIAPAATGRRCASASPSSGWSSTAAAAEPRTTRADGAPRRQITTTVDVRRRRSQAEALAAHGSQLDESWWSKIPPISGATSSARSRSSRARHDRRGRTGDRSLRGPALIDGGDTARARGAHPAAADRDACAVADAGRCRVAA